MKKSLNGKDISLFPFLFTFKHLIKPIGYAFCIGIIRKKVLLDKQESSVICGV